MNTLRFDFTVQGVAYQFRVERFEVTEALSAPFHINLSLISVNFDVEFEELARKPALLTLYGQGRQSARMFHGIINEVRYLGEQRRFALYQISLVPQCWFLTQRQDCRIFQQQSIPDIIGHVLDSASVTDYRLELSATYLPLDYILQYRETDSHFMQRLFAENGIWYYFEHSAKNHTMVIVDSNDAITPLACTLDNGSHLGPLIYHTQSNCHAEHEHIFNLEQINRVRTNHVIYTDYHYLKPQIPQQASSHHDAKQDLAIFDYPGRYANSQVGTTRAAESMAEKNVDSQQISANSNVMRLATGKSVAICQHPRATINQEYTLINIVHSGRDPSVYEEQASDMPSTYHNTFIGIARQVIFCAPKMLAPHVEGPQTAVVVGPEHEEIYTDYLGRIKVQFHWDRYGQKDEHSSCWIRVSQSIAASTWGAVCLPRIGHEVIVTFLDGDPDRPLVTGSVYNGINYPPYSLPSNKTRTTFRTQTYKGDGYNELSFEDQANQEEIYIHAQKNMSTRVLNHRFRDIGQDEFLKVGRHQTNSIAGNQQENIDGDKQTHVNGTFNETVEQEVNMTYNANHTHHVKNTAKLIVGDNRSITIGKNNSLDIGENSTVNVGNSRSVDISADDNQTVGGNMTVSVTRNISLKSDAVTQVISADKIVLKTGGASLVMSSDGTIKLSGTAITIEGTDKIVVKGGKVAINQ